MAIKFTQRFRRQVAPYNVMASLQYIAGANYCPAMQTLKADGTYSVDRGSCPTVLAADISATAPDNSGSIKTAADTSVTNIVWYMQGPGENEGTDITAHPDWAPADYVIGTGANKGRLTIHKNLPPGSNWRVWMKCTIDDRRRGYTVPVEVVTDSIMLYTIADATPIYSMTIDRSNGELYDLALDRKLLHEYKIGKGLPSTFTDDGNSHIRKVHVTLKSGADIMQATDYQIKVFAQTAAFPVDVTAGDNCYLGATCTAQQYELTFDTLFATEKTYTITCYVGGVEVAHCVYGFVWRDDAPTTDEGIVTGATFVDSDTHTCRVKLNYAGSLLEHPCIAFNLMWVYNRHDINTSTYVGSGEEATYDLTDNAMFPTNTNEAEAAVEITRKGVFTVVTVGSDTLTDASGNRYIEN